VIAGIGRSWVDEILWESLLSPFKRGADLDDEAAQRLHDAIGSTLQGAIDHYEEVIPPDVVPDKPPMPLKVHNKQGEDCPRCGAKLEAVFFRDYVTTYCPQEQTGGQVLKDRRLSRLLK
jgi:formamidopyrimidine-DNA glycosylase